MQRHSTALMFTVIWLIWGAITIINLPIYQERMVPSLLVWALICMVHCIFHQSFFHLDAAPAIRPRYLFILLTIQVGFGIALWLLIYDYAIRALMPYLAHLLVFGIARLWVSLVSGSAIIAAGIMISLLTNEATYRATIMDLVDCFLFILASRILLEFDNRRRKAKELRQRKHDRDRIAHDVHELLGESLSTIIRRARSIESSTTNDSLKQQTTEIMGISRQAMQELHYTVAQLRSRTVEEEIEAATQALEAAGITAIIHRDGILTHQEFSWVLREIVTNVIRHSHATRCVINIGNNHLIVHDNGVGIGTQKRGNGITGVTERVTQAGGTIDFNHANGTKVTAVLPATTHIR